MNNDINIAYRAHIFYKLKKNYSSFCNEIDKITEFYNSLSPDVKKKYDLIPRKQYLYNLFSSFETLFVDSATIILIGYPGKIGKINSDTDILTEVNTLTEALRYHTEKKMKELSYKRTYEFYKEVFKIFGEDLCIGEDILGIIIEGKATRDLYMHNNGKSNHIYFNKVGKYARVNENDIELKIKDDYLFSIRDALIALANEFNTKCINKHSKDTPARIFKKMWEMSSLNNLVKFETQWEIGKGIFSDETIYIKDHKWGWSGSEQALFNFFLQIHNPSGRTDSDTHISDIPYTLLRWKGSINERIIQSWLESQFHL